MFRSTFDSETNEAEAVAKVAELQRKYDQICDELSPQYPYLDKDPFLCRHDQTRREDLLRRFLAAENMNVEKAAGRVRATIMFRKAWNVEEYHQPGAASRIIPDSENPGAQMYFADSLKTDKHHQPYIVGRLQLLSESNMHPWRHLRAAIFVIERMSLKLAPGMQTSYILDLGKINFRGSYSGTGGTGVPTHRKRSRHAHEGREASDELLKEFGELSPGLSVLRAAIHIATAHYPEILSRVAFLHSDLLFYSTFKVFSLWVNHRTRKKFHFYGNGWGDTSMARLQEHYDSDNLFVEFGGAGGSLDGDGFLRRAVEHYQ